MTINKEEVKKFIKENAPKYRQVSFVVDEETLNKLNQIKIAYDFDNQSSLFKMLVFTEYDRMKKTNI
jgi:hypothetical protein